MDFEAVIGLEVHCQLATQTKIFCGCPSKPPEGVSVGETDVNSRVCPVCAGHPGTLPVLNGKVLEFAVRAGLATDCRINLRNVFARKNYFYPDLPKGYQLSQYELPICEHGALEIHLEGDEPKRIPIVRIHMEEDAGKNVHLSDCSLVNLNRAGVPLIEIVTAPAMRTPAEAGAYLRELHAVVTTLGICDGNMQEGNFRCDANVSIRPRGTERLGTRVEIKNVNSFRFVEKAIEHEIRRQASVIESGGAVVQETRLFDSAKNATVSMRSKEEAEDYRYFPDPDLMPVVLEGSWVEQIRAALPELPRARRVRYVAEFGLSPYDAAGVTSSSVTAALFEGACARLGPEARGKAKHVANLLNGEVTRLLNEADDPSRAGRLTPAHLADLVTLLATQVISSTGAKQALVRAWTDGESIASIVDALGLKQVSDLGQLEPVIEKVLAANAAQVAEFLAGKEKVLGFFVGQVMKASGGKANPGLVGELIRKKIHSGKI